jgi:hypothetical protein
MSAPYPDSRLTKPPIFRQRRLASLCSTAALSRSVRFCSLFSLLSVFSPVVFACAFHMEGDFTHLTHGFTHTPSVYSASNLDDDATSIASSRLTHDRDRMTINDDDAFSEVNGDDTASVVGLATRRRGSGPADGDEEDIETLNDEDAKLPDWACAYVSP